MVKMSQGHQMLPQFLGRQTGGGGWGVATPPPPLSFGEEGLTPPTDFERKKFNCSDVGPFLIA